jgi:hypothetical protein
MTLKICDPEALSVQYLMLPDLTSSGVQFCYDEHQTASLKFYSRPVIPILKATGLLNQTGAPTEIYAQFQTDAGRPAAALQALRNGFGEIFRRNQYAHKAEEAALVDVIVAITGLPRKEGIVRYILNTFQAFQDYAKQAREDGKLDEQSDAGQSYDATPALPADPSGSSTGRLQLAYNINVVLPETTNVEVYNAIFKSLKANLLA